MDPEKPTAVVAAERMTQSMETLATELRVLRSYGRRNRHLIWALGLAWVFNLALAMAVGYVGITAQDASDRATKAVAASRVIADNQRATCLSSNEARKVQVDLWHFVLAGVPASQQTNDFRTYVDTAFAQRQC